jgi:hypothetical protein
VPAGVSQVRQEVLASLLEIDPILHAVDSSGLKTSRVLHAPLGILLRGWRPWGRFHNLLKCLLNTIKVRTHFGINYSS